VFRARLEVDGGLFSLPLFCTTRSARMMAGRSALALVLGIAFP